MTGTVTSKNPKPDLTIWAAPISRTSTVVTRMKVDLKCMTCGKTWGLWVQNEALPPNWDECRECKQRKAEEKERENNRDIRDLYNADVRGVRKEQ